MLHPHRDHWEMSFVIGGDAALQACEKTAFDVIVSDLRMPGMDGAELLGKIRDRYPGAARIVLSGYSDVALSARAVPVAHRVLSKPCDPIQLRYTIDRVCALQDVLCTPALRELIGTLGELPSLSSTYMALESALRRPDVSISAVAKIIEQDVAMSAKVLQIVNSGFFGLSRIAPSLEFAVSYLGLETIRMLALYSDTFRVFTPDPRIPSSFWPTMQVHSQRTAAIAGTFPLSRETREIAIMAAFLHDVGTLVLASLMPDQFCAVLEEMKKKESSQAEVEEKMFGISHAEVGAYLLGLWGINTDVVEAIAHHHQPMRVCHKDLDCATVVYIANLLAHEIDAHPYDSGGDDLGERDIKILNELGLLDQYPVYRENAEVALKTLVG